MSHPIKLLLASKSPRRRELLSLLQLPFTCINLGEVEEHYPKDLPVEEVAPYLSRLKADAYPFEIHGDEVLVTADTVVCLDGRIYGKPADDADACRMLRDLSGKTHTVVSGVTLTSPSQRVTFDCRTKVKFADLSDKEILYYVDTFHPLDKAGAYGIQEWIGAVGVESIEGSFYNVMGLPVHQLHKHLASFII